MTKKDFELIANVISDIRKSACVLTEGEKSGVKLVATSLGRAFRSTNPRFKYDRFITACGFED